MNPEICFNRNIHGRSLEDIKKTVSVFEPAPDSNLILNPTPLFELADKEKTEREEEARRRDEEEKGIFDDFDAEGVSWNLCRKNSAKIN